MKKNLFLLILLFVSSIITSCNDDVVINSESEILSFKFDESGSESKIVSVQPVIDNTKREIMFVVTNEATAESIKDLVPTIKISAGATITPASGVEADFSIAEPVTYLVTAEDGIAKSEYKVMCSRETANIGEELNGVYKGNLDIQLNGDVVGADVLQKIYITKIGDNLIKIELKNFSFEGISLGDISLDEVAVIKSEGVNAFSGEQNIVLAVGACDVSVVGVIDGDDMDVDITVGIPAMENSVVLVDFEGVKMEMDQSSEAMITAFSFAGVDNIVSVQPVIEGTNITFVVLGSATPEQISALVPTITISEKATIDPATGVAADFNSAVIYKVTSEDEIYTTEYTVYIDSKATVYSFEEWKEIFSEPDFFNPDVEYLYSEVFPLDVLGSSNQGAILSGVFGTKNNGNVLKSEDGISGNAAKLVTLDNRDASMSMIPRIIPASLFIGSFEADMAEPLKSTKFGIKFENKKPLSFKGYYKYKSGAEFLDAFDPKAVVVVPNKKDVGSIVAVLFEVETDDEVLTGVDINNSPKIVATALVGGVNTEYKPNGISEAAEWTTFDIPFTYMPGKSYDSTKKYKVAFVCSSSLEGDRFNGAPGSTLFVDEFEIVYEDMAPAN